MVTALLSGYVAHLWAKQPLRTVHNEINLRYSLIPGVDLKSRVDGVIPRLGQRPVLYELKTTSETLDAKEAELRVGYQLAVYAYLYEVMHGERVAGAVVEVLKKPVKGGPGACKKKPDETWQEWLGRVAVEYGSNPDRYFRRAYIHRDDIDVPTCLEEIHRCAHAMQLWDERGYPRIPGQCDGKYGPCRYKRLCWHGDETGYVKRPYQFDGSDVSREQEQGNGISEKTAA
jgi:hypothetical protein